MNSYQELLQQLHSRQQPGHERPEPSSAPQDTLRGPHQHQARHVASVSPHRALGELGSPRVPPGRQESQAGREAELRLPEPKIHSLPARLLSIREHQGVHLPGFPYFTRQLTKQKHHPSYHPGPELHYSPRNCPWFPAQRDSHVLTRSNTSCTRESH